MDIDIPNLTGQEKEMAEELLRTAHAYGLPEDFSREGLRVTIHNGRVCLENTRGEFAALNYANLETFFSCPACGYEDFEEGMLAHAQDEACQDFLRRIGLITEDDKEEVRELTKRERILKALAAKDGLYMDSADDREELAEAILEMFEIFQEEESMELHIEDFGDAMEAIRSGARWLEEHSEEVSEEVGPVTFPDLPFANKSSVKEVARFIERFCDALE
jgi:hypothetical protein